MSSSSRFSLTTLSNGLRVAVEHSPTMKSVTVGVWVNAGSRDEDAPIMGVSHFLEHMMFKGTDTLSTHELNLAFDRMGAVVNNASTSFDSTNYFAKVIPSHTEDALKVLAEMMRPALRAEDFNMEKNVILEEIALYLDRPPFEVMVKGMAKYFDGHSLAYPILGTPESIRGMTYDQMRAYWASRYSPRNMVVVAVGAVTPEQFVPMVEKACGAWEGTAVARTLGGVPAYSSGVQIVHQPNFSRQHMLFLSPAPPRDRTWEEIASVLTTVLGDQEHSRLYWELAEPGLVDTASLEDMSFEDCGAFAAYVSCEPAKAKEVAQKTLEILRSPALPKPDEMEMAKNKLMTSTILEAEHGVGRYYALGSEILAGFPYRTLEDEAKAYDAITPDHVQSLLKAYPMKDWSVTTIGPLEKLEV